MIGCHLPFVRSRPTAGALQHRTDTWNDDAGRVVFVASTSLPGVRFLCKAGPVYSSNTLESLTSTPTNLALGWNGVRDPPGHHHHPHRP